MVSVTLGFISSSFVGDPWRAVEEVTAQRERNEIRIRWKEL